MTRATRWFLRSPVAANLLMVTLVAGGIAAILNLTVRAFPEIASSAVTVTVAYPGASPTEVAEAILTPIEEELEGLEGLRKLSGSATAGTGTVRAELTRGAALDEVRDDIETAIARITTFPAPTEVITRNGARIVTVEADVDSAVTTGGAETAWVQRTVVPELEADLPGVTVTAGGKQEEAGRFGPALALNFGLALLAIHAILTLAFGSFTRPLIVLGAIPFGFVGAVFGHWLLGLDLTLLSMFGVVGLAGVIVNDALLIVDYVIEREAGGADRSPRRRSIAPAR
ncbi:efflux RND transporter permease subunit [Jannaschia formosa]|uniref:efflux RND transporter permease subunit n=1 Tax=Jannaschia formosa TaxID=2259592 RepID=UPI000E1B7517|nr:efflux RND transporter permease subunit [Jannaschia formosa]TFL18822.1 hypothetical protein DR046_07830 [Jannaschia formosa]